MEGRPVEFKLNIAAAVVVVVVAVVVVVHIVK